MRSSSANPPASSPLARKTAALLRSRPVIDALSALTPLRQTHSVSWSRIGVLLQWGIGDAVLATPLLAGLKARFPQASIEVIGPQWLGELFAGEPWLGAARVMVPPWTAHRNKYHWRRHQDWQSFLKGLLAIRKLRYDLIVSQRMDPRDAIQMRLLAPLATAGFRAAGGRHWVGKNIGIDVEEFFLTARSQIAAVTLEALTNTPASPVPSLRSEDAVRRDVLLRMRTAGYRGGTVLAVHTGAGTTLRRWSPDKFPQVLKKVGALADFVVQIDDGTANYSLEAAHRIPSMNWTGGLSELKALLTITDVLLCCDSGIMHLAAACGCRVVAIFGPGSTQMFAPAGEGHVMVKVEPMPCRPCFDRCIYSRPVCMDRITVDQVVEALSSSLTITTRASHFDGVAATP